MLTAAELGRPSKRAFTAYDESCEGVYDKRFLSKLNNVCQDCYNLYRKRSVSIDCRYSFLQQLQARVFQ